MGFGLSLLFIVIMVLIFQLEKNTFVNFNCVFIDNNKIKIGSNVLIGPGVHFYSSSHPVKSKERVKSDGQYITNALPIKVGNNVWIGGNSSICQGVKFVVILQLVQIVLF